ncbi:TLC domain-containing protein 2-like isoform X1 [Lineus longissimus]|uniref:TLC domain-containing protein 2-like isoform X1 n=1 Tax=Lineus longissimus TaxID=88925 RepID=UPI002B4F4054
MNEPVLMPASEPRIPNIDDTKNGILIVIFSFIFFFTIEKLLNFFIPKGASSHKTWQFKNILVSLVHSCISSIWAFSSFVESPEMAEDLISVYTQFSHSLVSFSVGYFIHDVVHMLSNNKSRQSFELIGHHIVVCICFGVAIVFQKYVGYAVVALTVEWNSIFLHIRQIMHILAVPRSGTVYRINSLITLVTFVAFRITTLSWMTRWIVINRDLLPFVMYTIGSAGLAIITVMNIVLFYRLLNTDFLSRRKEIKKN